MNKTIATLFVIFFFSQGCLGKGFTPMEIDNHPCTPENLKVHCPIHWIVQRLKVRGPFGSLDFQTLLVLGPLQKLLLPLTFRSNVPLLFAFNKSE